MWLTTHLGEPKRFLISCGWQQQRSGARDGPLCWVLFAIWKELNHSQNSRSHDSAGAHVCFVSCEEFNLVSFAWGFIGGGGETEQNDESNFSTALCHCCIRLFESAVFLPTLLCHIEPSWIVPHNVKLGSNETETNETYRVHVRHLSPAACTHNAIFLCSFSVEMQRLFIYL